MTKRKDEKKAEEAPAPRIDDAMAEAIFRARREVTSRHVRHDEATAAKKAAKDDLDAAQVDLEQLLIDAEQGQGQLFPNDEQMREVITNGGRRDTVKAVAECEDPDMLQSILDDPDLGPPWRRTEVTRRLEEIRPEAVAQPEPVGAGGNRNF